MNDASVSDDGAALSDDALAAFVAERTARLELDDGTTIVVRPGTRDDRPFLLDGLRHLSERSIYTRFLRPLSDLTEKEIEHLLSVDQNNHFAWAAFDDQGHPIAVARYIREVDRPSFAEAAVTVVDDFQRRGIGRVLIQLLAQSAIDNGVEHFVAYVGADNSGLGAALAAAGAYAEESDEYATTFVIDLPLEAPFDDSVLLAALRATAHPGHP